MMFCFTLRYLKLLLQIFSKIFIKSRNVTPPGTFGGGIDLCRSGAPGCRQWDESCRAVMKCHNML